MNKNRYLEEKILNFVFLLLVAKCINKKLNFILGKIIEKNFSSNFFI